MFAPSDLTRSGPVAAEPTPVEATTSRSSAPEIFLSVIIPAYNEEKRIRGSLEQVLAFYASQPYASEVIVVDDGSADSTAQIVEEFMKDNPTLRLVKAQHGGKGHACKEGVFASRGQWLFLCDTDLSMPIEDFAKFVPFFKANCEIVIASREVPGARRFDEPPYRHLMGRVFNLLVRVLAVHGIQDTQCGFKSFRADVARRIFGVQTIDGWGFDVEVLFVAQKYGYTITEVPINWYYGSNSKISPVRDTINMFREVWKVRLNNWNGLYDHA